MFRFVNLIKFSVIASFLFLTFSSCGDRLSSSTGGSGGNGVPGGDEAPAPLPSSVKINADFTCIPSAGNPLSVNFKNESSVTDNGVPLPDPSVWINSYLWDFGEEYSDNNSSSETNPAHTYLLAGEQKPGNSSAHHQVTLTVTDVNGGNIKVTKKCEKPLRFEEIVTFKNSSYLRRNDGIYFGFGANDKFQLGINSAAASSSLGDNITVPSKINSVPYLYTAFTNAGSSYGNSGYGPVGFLAAGVSPNGKTLYYWGSFDGTNEVGGTNCSGSPKVCSIAFNEAEGKAKSVKAGNSFILIESDNGKLYSFGMNDKGQLGYGESGNGPFLFLREVALPAGKLDFYEAFEDYAYASVNNVLYAWGNNRGNYQCSGCGITGNYLQVKPLDGADYMTVLRVPAEVDVPSGTAFSSIFMGSFTYSENYHLPYTLGLTASGAVYSWGSNAGGSLGQDNSSITVSNIFSQKAAKVPLVSPIGGISVYSYPLTRDASGKLYVWGNNGNYLGAATPVSSNSPNAVDMSGMGSAVFSEYFFSGLNSSYAFDNSGNLWGWGYNSDGRIGNGSTSNVIAPEKISVEPLDPLALALSAYGPDKGGVLALSKDHKTLYVWGNNDYGQLGLPPSGSSSVLNAVTSPKKLDLSAYILQ